MINAFYYDHAGDEISPDDFQTSWKTQFANIGVVAQLTHDTQLLAQAVTGSTAWIPLANGPVAKVDDVGFRSAYLLLDHTFGSQGVAARLDAFETTDENQAYSLNSTPETGWSLTAAWRNQLNTSLMWMIEGVYIDSERASRGQVGADPQQSQLQVQTSLRLGY